MRSSRALLIPPTLIALGILLLIGCLPIPATRQFQDNGKPRPEYLIGQSPSSAIVLGRTHITDAFIAISNLTEAKYQTSSGFIFSRPKPMQANRAMAFS